MGAPPEPKRFYDFDAAWAEATAEPVVIVAFGETIKLPAEEPASVVLMWERETTGQAFLDGCTAIFGDERIKQWLSDGISFEKLGELMASVHIMYMGEDPGEAKARAAAARATPNREARRATKKAAPRKKSSPTGRSSKPTLPASTGST